MATKRLNATTTTAVFSFFIHRGNGKRYFNRTVPKMLHGAAYLGTAPFTTTKSSMEKDDAVNTFNRTEMNFIKMLKAMHTLQSVSSSDYKDAWLHSQEN